MQVTIEDLREISILAELESDELVQLQPHAMVKTYQRGEIVFHEGVVPFSKG